MRKLLWAIPPILVIAVSAPFAVGVSGSQASSSQSKWIGRLAPNFTLPLRNGVTFRLQDELGKRIVVLDFFTSWCVPCRHEMPAFENYYAGHEKASDVMLIGIDVREKPQKVDELISEFHISFPVGIDSGSVEQQYAAYEFPTMVVIGLDKRIRFYQAGEIENLGGILDRTH